MTSRLLLSILIVILVPGFTSCNSDPPEGTVYEHALTRHRIQIERVDNCESLHQHYERLFDYYYERRENPRLPGHSGTDAYRHDQFLQSALFPRPRFESGAKRCFAHYSRDMLEGLEIRVVYMRSLDQLKREYVRIN